MTDVVLEVRELRKHFDGVMATDGVQLDLVRGELHALIGPNGAGKTTLIQLLCGALRPDGGNIRFDGRDVTRMSLHQRVALGLARSYQITSTFPNLSVLENLVLPVLARSGSSMRFWRSVEGENDLHEEARRCAAQVGLAGREHTRARDLSHGEQRQLEVGLALATRASVLLLDEPMAGLGPDESRAMTKLLMQIKGSVSILLVEHDMDAVFELADRISVLVAGRIIASGRPDEIRANDEVRRAYLGDELVV